MKSSKGGGWAVGVLMVMVAWDGAVLLATAADPPMPNFVMHEQGMLMVFNSVNVTVRKAQAREEE
jgi:hypothetical protein